MKACMKKVFDGETMANNWSCAGPIGGTGMPSISFTSVPSLGSFDNLRGSVSHIVPKDYAVAVYIYVNGGWWSKPTWAGPKTSIGCDGTWVCDITTGGVDQDAIQIAAFLVPVSVEAPLASGSATLTEELNVIAAAQVSQDR
jgi:hypothetical protein